MPRGGANRGQGRPTRLQQLQRRVRPDSQLSIADLFGQSRARSSDVDEVEVAAADGGGIGSRADGEDGEENPDGEDGEENQHGPNVAARFRQLAADARRVFVSVAAATVEPAIPTTTTTATTTTVHNTTLEYVTAVRKRLVENVNGNDVVRTRTCNLW